MKKPADIQLFTSRNETSRNETENTTEVLPKTRYYKLDTIQSKINVSQEVRGSKTPTKPKIPLQDSFSKRGNDPIVSARK